MIDEFKRAMEAQAEKERLALDGEFYSPLSMEEYYIDGARWARDYTLIECSQKLMLLEEAIECLEFYATGKVLIRDDGNGLYHENGNRAREFLEKVRSPRGPYDDMGERIRDAVGGGA